MSILASGTRRASLLTAFGVLATSASAQTFDYSFDASVSSLAVNADVAVDLTGNLKGVFDAALNPGGTRTILGLFGDDGMNAEAPVTIVLGVDAILGGALVGGFDLSYDAALGTVTVEGLNATVGAAGTSSADLNVTLNYSTFRTVNPGSAFIGGFPLTLPIGAAAVTDVVLAQSMTGAGVGVPGASAGLVDVTAGVPVELSFNLDLSALGGGGVIPVGPLPLVLPIDGTLDLADCGTVLSSAAQELFMQTVPGQGGFAITDLPLPLPTILPPGNTADLLLNATVDQLTVNGDVRVAISADAGVSGRTEVICESNPNSSGIAAVLGTSGSTSVGSADLALVATELPMNSLGYLLMSQTEDLVPGFGGSQGTLCLGGTIYRFSLSVQSSGQLGEVSFAPDFNALPGGQQFVAGESWNFQYWFRDANPAVTSNTTGAVRVLFCQ